MDLNILRIAVTLASFGLFIGICCWAWAKGNQARFDEAARLPLLDEAEDAR